MMRRIGGVFVPAQRVLPARRVAACSPMAFSSAATRSMHSSSGLRRIRLPVGPGASATLLLRTTNSGTQVSLFSTSRTLLEKPKDENTSLGAFNTVEGWKPGEDQKEDEQESGIPGPEPGYLPFPAPFHTINVISLLLIANLLCYFLMNFSTDEVRDFLVEHATLSHENAHRIYPFFTHALYQENLLQLAIDSWLLMQFGRTMFGFLGGARLAAFWAMTQVGGGLIHIGRQYAQLYYEMDPLEVRGRCYGANPFILGLVGVEGLIFRNLNFLQNPPVPFLVLTAFVMVIDIWRIFTTKPEEHGASTGGALVAYIFWALPTRRMGLDKLTAKM